MAPLHPESEAILRDLVAFWADPPSLTVEHARGGMRGVLDSASAPQVDMAEVVDTHIPGPGGDIPVRVYRPHGDVVDGAFVWLHGGGYALGSVTWSDLLVRELAAASGCVVVSVDYRLSPEHPFPAGLEDGYAAVRWISDHPADFGFQSGAVVVGGDSAGGNLAAGVARLARERGGPSLELQVLVYPMTYNCPVDFPSRDMGPLTFPSSAAVAWVWEHYLGTSEGSRDPLPSPGLADDLEGLPPALIVTAEYDFVRDEGEQYGMRLVEAGVPVEMRRYTGMIHGFLDFGGVPVLAPAVRDGFDLIGRGVRSALLRSVEERVAA